MCRHDTFKVQYFGLFVFVLLLQGPAVTLPMIALRQSCFCSVIQLHSCVKLCQCVTPKPVMQASAGVKAFII